MRRAVALVFLLVPALAHATPHALPFSYPYATLAQGAIEIEQYTDLTPIPVIDFDGDPIHVPQVTLTTELEYGITDKLELGLYFQLSDFPSGEPGGAIEYPARIDGIKQRLRYRLAEANEWPVDVSLYGEVAELQQELEFEGKINLEKRIGRLQLLVNLWAEREWYYAGQQEWVLNPTGGGDWEINPNVHIGLEGWMHAEYGGTVNSGNPNLGGSSVAFNPAPHVFLGPTLELGSGRFWFTVAPYVQLTDLGRSGQIGDQYGRFWIRSIVGVEL